MKKLLFFQKNDKYNHSQIPNKWNENANIIITRKILTNPEPFFITTLAPISPPIVFPIAANKATNKSTWPFIRKTVSTKGAYIKTRKTLIAFACTKSNPTLRTSADKRNIPTPI